jgi:hypothetical protein
MQDLLRFLPLFVREQFMYIKKGKAFHFFSQQNNRSFHSPYLYQKKTRVV